MVHRRTFPACVPTLVDTATGVALRAHEPGDVPAIVEQSNDPESIRFTTVPTPYTEADAMAWVGEWVPSGWRSDAAAYWAIEAEIDGVRRFCGSIEVRFNDDVRGEIGFGLHPAARGRGILSVAGRLALDWAFDTKRLGVVRWAAYVGNWPSRYAAAAMGFRQEGIRRAHMRHRGELVDCWSAAILPSDPRVSLLPPRQPALAGDRVRLRALTEADVPRIVEACADPATQRWLPDLPDPYTHEAARAFVEWCREGAFTGDLWTWAVTDPAAPDRLLGAITLFRLRDPAAQGEIGYWLHPEARGRGVMSDAVRAVAAYALGAGPHQSLLVRCSPDNIASRRVAEHAGFAPLGVLPRAERRRDGGSGDLAVFVRLR